MTYGIICAMQEEFLKLSEVIENKEVVSLYGRDFIKGKINETSVVAVVSRIGKVAAGVTTMLLIDKFKIDAAIFCGIAGSLSDNVKIGDIVISDKCVQHDFYLSDSDIFRIPLLNVSYIPADEALTEKAKAAAVEFSQNLPDEAKEFNSNPKIHIGTVASGDQFISSTQKKEWIASKAENAKCCEMEGAAVAQVCYEANVPYTVIRVISDGADDDADINFEKFVNTASIYTKGIIKSLLK
ncbi:MAG: 5'-methylthioadenosine/adenosylhomocysteine nucleosidase [Oscillospiraceae bacterium]|nr:5'-methylthioadenosine/adenosylhomocysteine nucleosidase [Oscillospiraceae bacterium]